MSKVIVTALILAIVSSISCQSCSYEANIDYFGNDLFTNFIYYATQDLCCAACAANPDCQAWTFVTPTNACWLKRQIGNLRIASPGRNSGVKQQISTFSTTLTTTAFPIITTTTAIVPTTTTTVPTTTLKNSICQVDLDSNYPGNDLAGRANVASAGDCCNLCGSTVGCASWSFYSQFNYCFLKSVANNAANRQAYPGIISGTVV